MAAVSDDDRKAAAEAALDLFVYAPLGFALEARGLQPRFVERGKNQVTMARMVGQFAVQQGQVEATKRLGPVQEQVETLLAGKPDALVILPNEPDALMPVAQKAMAAGIPVIDIDREFTEQGAFRSLMDEQRSRAKADAAARKHGGADASAYREVLERTGLTDFLGYSDQRADATIVGLIVAGACSTLAAGGTLFALEPRARGLALPVVRKMVRRETDTAPA